MYNFNDNKFALNKNKTNIFGKILKVFFVIALIFFTCVYLFYVFFFQVQIYGSSMYPTFSKNNDQVAVAMRIFNLTHGDTIVIQSSNILILKRAIALGNDKISLVFDKESEYCSYYLNDKKLNEPYIYKAEDMNKKYFEKVEKLKNIVREENTEEIILSLQLESDEIFVLGDNRGVSADSSSTGPIKSNQVLGKVVFKYYFYK